MAIDKAIDSAQLDMNLQNIANAIRTQSGVETTLAFPMGFINTIEQKLGNKEDYLAAVLNKEITEIVNSKMKSIPPDFQLSNSKLTKAILPAVTKASSGEFCDCYYLDTVDFSSMQSIGAQFITSNGKLKELYMPSLTNMTSWGYTFNVCQALQKVVFPVFTGTITDASFNSCRNLETVVLGADTVCNLGSSNVFNGTKIKSGTGYIYVKRALIDAYKAATNWSTYAAQFRAIEDYPGIMEA